MSKEILDEITKIHTPEDVMKFFDDFIEYGCIDVCEKRWVDSLGGHDFRDIYRTLSLEDSLDNKIGACFEQANISKFVLDTIGIKNRIFCTRGFNEEHKEPTDLYLVHCYVLGYWGDKIINIEHSDSDKRGIYVYDLFEDAIRETHNIFSDKFKLHGASTTRCDEFFDFIPGGLTFVEFNDFINESIRQ